MLQLLVQGQSYIVALNSKYKGIVCGVEEDAPCAAVAFARSVPLYVYYVEPLYNGLLKSTCRHVRDASHRRQGVHFFSYFWHELGL